MLKHPILFQDTLAYVNLQSQCELRMRLSLSLFENFRTAIIFFIAAFSGKYFHQIS